MSAPEIPDFRLGRPRRSRAADRSDQVAPAAPPKRRRLPAPVETLVTPAEPPEASYCRGRLAALMGELADPRLGSWWMGVQPVIAVRGGPALRPDLAAWRGGAPGTRAPDWVADVVLPSTAAELRVHRRSRYSLVGVGHVWLLDPIGRVLEALRRGPHGWELVGAWTDGDIVSIDPFAGDKVEISRLLPPR